MRISPTIIQFTKSLFLGLILVYVLDLFLGYLAKKSFFSLKYGQYAQMTYAIDSTNQDIIIMGSSRASHHYESSLISEALNMSVYNAGRDGQFIPYNCALLDAISLRSKPKMLILDVNVWDLAPNDEKYEKLAMLLPYYSNHPEFLKYIEEISKWENLKILSKSYPYNSTLFVTAYDHLFTNLDAESDYGFVPLKRTIGKKDFEVYQIKKAIYDLKREKENVPFDSKAINYYAYFLAKVVALQIPTYVIISPTLLKEPNTKEKLKLETMAKLYPMVKFIDFSLDSAFNNQYESFADEFHLNQAGANEFSLKLSDLLLAHRSETR